MIKLYHKMFILGIETTCDETGIALIEAKENKVRILKNELALNIKFIKNMVVWCQF
jgi:tRNA A37 threonylcarbamoyltransferase TsaD